MFSAPTTTESGATQSRNLPHQATDLEALVYPAPEVNPILLLKNRLVEIRRLAPTINSSQKTSSHKERISAKVAAEIIQTALKRNTNEGDSLDINFFKEVANLDQKQSNLVIFDGISNSPTSIKLHSSLLALSKKELEVVLHHYVQIADRFLSYATGDIASKAYRAYGEHYTALALFSPNDEISKLKSAFKKLKTAGWEINHEMESLDLAIAAKNKLAKRAPTHPEFHPKEDLVSAWRSTARHILAPYLEKFDQAEPRIKQRIRKSLSIHSGAAFEGIFSRFCHSDLFITQRKQKIVQKHRPLTTLEEAAETNQIEAGDTKKEELSNRIKKNSNRRKTVTEVIKIWRLEGTPINRFISLGALINEVTDGKPALIAHPNSFTPCKRMFPCRVLIESRFLNAAKKSDDPQHRLALSDLDREESQLFVALTASEQTRLQDIMKSSGVTRFSKIESFFNCSDLLELRFGARSRFVNFLKLFSKDICFGRHVSEFDAATGTPSGKHKKLIRFTDSTTDIKTATQLFDALANIADSSKLHTDLARLEFDSKVNLLRRWAQPASRETLKKIGVSDWIGSFFTSGELLVFSQQLGDFSKNKPSAGEWLQRLEASQEQVQRLITVTIAKVLEATQTQQQRQYDPIVGHILRRYGIFFNLNLPPEANKVLHSNLYQQDFSECLRFFAPFFENTSTTIKRNCFYLASDRNVCSPTEVAFFDSLANKLCEATYFGDKPRQQSTEEKSLAKSALTFLLIRSNAETVAAYAQKLGLNADQLSAIGELEILLHAAKLVPERSQALKLAGLYLDTASSKQQLDSKAFRRFLVDRTRHSGNKIQLQDFCSDQKRTDLIITQILEGSTERTALLGRVNIEIKQAYFEGMRQSGRSALPLLGNLDNLLDASDQVDLSVQQALAFRGEYLSFGKHYQKKNFTDYDRSQDVPNYFAVLGVPYAATADQVRTSYKLLVRVFHPDIIQGPGQAVSERVFKEIGEAYSVLSDETKYKNYLLMLQKNGYDRLHEFANVCWYTQLKEKMGVKEAQGTVRSQGTTGHNSDETLKLQ